MYDSGPGKEKSRFRIDTTLDTYTPCSIPFIHSYYIAPLLPLAESKDAMVHDVGLCHSFSLILHLTSSCSGALTDLQYTLKPIQRQSKFTKAADDCITIFLSPCIRMR